MSVGFDPSTDFEDITDGLEAVTLDRRGSSDNVSVTKALRRELSVAESRSSTGSLQVSDGQLRAGDTRWHLPQAEVTTTPRVGDVIEPSNGDRYQIMEVVLETLGNRWECVSRNLRIAYGLDDTVSIQKATYAKGDGGAQEATWTTYVAGVRARVQEVAATGGVAGGAKQTGRAYDVLLEADLELDAKHRIVDQRGRKYLIVGVTGRAEVGQPMTIEATAWRSG